ncbi:helix-turn-helix domain-containing protein [Pedobacter sp.]|jgi:hypothetical protein|uniref:helix-turn-helix domain-containing protein n=1 Tax=Pedobacter sp. TaxID=1411316 RepID=UPI002C075532|nr:helix-turn-helix domain-containing protein [Pedobacter sp.]HWW43120.1 helix-turn-helix domain-containing protein [Pedobacter sp.]
MNEDHLVTKDCLENFKTVFIKAIEDLLNRRSNGEFQKTWLKTAEVCKLLGISQGKLQAMRNARTITFTQIGGNMYYNVQDINEMFEANKTLALKEHGQHS